ncbi:FadR/GntR family transcriptional regulator [Streptomyces sp. TS71-3]|uniref:FadR/GntR family transcriptional regulator n=1 Tax=Streptomyces sp. TS71-3 TaxID=2733862 RepID=UPI001B1CC541|nr:FCD domain-containing protein [Streptomyces sp. TS71-3]GHJ35540.1 transcriptional regulator [Streptomyces sp. TS71-3]
MPGHRETQPVEAGASEAALPGLTAAPLTGIRRLSALDTVRARIALAIDLGLLAPGERLPATDRIAAALGVGEITVRRALASLHGEGLLERRRGRTGGTLVAERPTRGTVGAAQVYRSASADVHRLIDHRLVLECGIAHLAATHGDPDAVDRLDRLVEEMDRAPSWADFHGCDERFHLAVAGAVGVPSAAEPYGAVLRDLYRYYLPYPLDTLRESNDEHRALVAAIRRGDPAAAGDIARRHVEVLRRTMFVGLMEGT